MQRKWLCLLMGGAFLVTMGFSACGDNGEKDDDVDAGIDADLVDADLVDADLVDADTPDGEVPEPGCTGDSPAHAQEVGGCCLRGSDCVKGYCFAGYCTGQCTGDSDCEPVAVGPFPLDTEFNCNVNSMGFYSYCAPGSLQHCGGESDSPCPAGESCVLGWDDTTTVSNDPDQPGLRGVCMTNLYGEGVLAAGEQCDNTIDAADYQCEAPGYLFGSCMGRRCTVACDAANPDDTCPAGTECIGPIALETGGADLLLGTGFCGGQSCGRMEFSTNPDEDIRIPGLDADCPQGEVCTPFMILGAEGDVYSMRCIPEMTAYGAPGDTCEHARKFGQFCNHDLCLQASPVWQSDGAYCDFHEDCGPDEVCARAPNQFVRDRCAPKPDPGFCSVMCRSDADCPDMNGGPAYCITLGAGKLHNGQSAYLTACYPESELFEVDPEPCERESDCDTALGLGCFRLGNYSHKKFCDQSVTADPNGVECTNDPTICENWEACVEDFDTGVSTCTSVGFVGDPCTPGEGECLSGWCFDGEFDIEDDGGNPTNTFCSAVCTTTDDCGANQVCENILWAKNDPDTSDDDITGGICRPMTVRIQSEACENSDECDGDKVCDTDTGRCFDPASEWGSACTDDSDCNQNGLCNTNVPNGLCYKPGCDPANPGDYCGTGDAVCSENSSVGVCLEECTQDSDCSRHTDDGHICVNGACESP